jgi:hypothetical protein
MSWDLPATGSSIELFQNGKLIGSLGGASTSHTETPGPGTYEYCMYVRIGDGTGPTVCCNIVVPEPLSGIACSTFGDATAYVTDVPVTDQSLADALASSELNRLSRQFLRGSARLQGVGVGLRAGAMVTFKGLPSSCNGRFFVISTRRTWSTAGVSIDIRFCSNTAGESA